jgi:hypothetical protein
MSAPNARYEDSIYRQAASTAPSTPPRRPFDRLLRRADLLRAYAPLVDDFSAALELVEDLAPADAEAALTSRMVTYLDALADALGAALPAAEGSAAA